MVFTQEQALLKGQQQFEQLIAAAQRAADQHQRIDTVERELMTRLLALGHSMLGLFLARQGDGDQGETIAVEGPALLKRLSQPHSRRYPSILFTNPLMLSAS